MDAVLCRGETAQEEGFTNVAAAPWAAKSAVSCVLRGELPFVEGCCPASGLVRLRGDRPNGGPQGACPSRRRKLRASRAELTARGRGLGSPRPPAPPAPPWSPVLRRRAGARAARRLWRTPPDRRAQWMGAGRRSDGRTAAAWGRDEGSACGETAVSSRQCADVFGAGQDSRCVCP